MPGKKEAQQREHKIQETRQNQIVEELATCSEADEMER